MRLLLGDCIDKLKELDDNSIDSIVTDPPYGLSFMGKDWDKKKATQETKSQVVKGLGAGMKMTTLADNIEFEKWVTEWASECMRVLKPGGYMLAFGGSRMYHRLASGVENAGFEIRDQMMWVYGSGFPKSMNIGKGIDKKNGQSKIELKFVEWYRTVGISAKETNKIIGTKDTGSHYLRLDQPYLPTKVFWEKLKPHITVEIPNWVDKLIERVEAEREVIEKKRVQRNSSSWDDCSGMLSVGEQNFDITAPATDEAKQWEGWGTALKPAHEPIVMARKPLSEKTVVDNVLEWGTGGINIDESRIGVDEDDPNHRSIDNKNVHTTNFANNGNPRPDKIPNQESQINSQGRFPANIIFDEEAGKILDEQSGTSKSSSHISIVEEHTSPIYGKYDKSIRQSAYDDMGGASRFFYCPKTSKTDRNEGLDGFEEKRKSHITSQNFENALTGGGNTRNPYSKNNHPTVKPTDLMLYLIRLVTPKGGTTLDPFMGSGSSGKAAVRGGFEFVGIEREEEYMEIATARIQYEKDNPYNEEKGERVEINKNSNKFW